MWENLIRELKKEMSAVRLANVGMFQKLTDINEIQDEELKKCIRLHRAVLDKALLDTFSPAKHIRDRVEAWLFRENPEFIEACERALLPPDRVYYTFKIMKKIIRGKNSKFREFGRYKKKKTTETVECD
jgi:hypothetical protein